MDAARPQRGIYFTTFLSDKVLIVSGLVVFAVGERTRPSIGAPSGLLPGGPGHVQRGLFEDQS